MKGYQNRVVIISVVLAVLVLISLIRATMNVKNLRKNFRQEMAQRFDIEEKMIKMEKEHGALVFELKALRDELHNKSQEIDSLREELARAGNEKAALKESIEKTQAGSMESK